ncbi:28S ribosomal protein S31, mitochondrial-like isoform X2 [Mustela putorius furo]|uniref:Small ribosomal subunit protein mS31 n=1 Tax=Mustela putorius furo TaxID=9669 RepID=A0A8U0UVA1_MUSPF|nr:28S ribosomal protein S31, mitochondrial-like isoform X2 [Mustela putorius furo]
MFPRVSAILPLRPLSRFPLCSGGSEAAIVLLGAPHGTVRTKSVSPELEAAASTVADFLRFDKQTTKSELLRQLQQHEEVSKAQKDGERTKVSLRKNMLKRKRLNIFDLKAVTKEAPETETAPSLWDVEFAKQLAMVNEQPLQNGFAEMIQWTKEGKLWEFPIDNEAGVGKGNGSDGKVQIMMQSQIVFFCSASKNCRILHDAETDSVTIHLSNCPPLYDDFKVQFFSSSDLPKYYDQCPCFFWFHTSFLQNKMLYLPRNQLHNPHKKKKKKKTWNIYLEEFAVELYFEEVG